MSIASELSRLQQAKSDLATSITNKGVTVPAATTLDGYAALVDQIQQGGGTLPYDSKIEYIESTGAQYIDTGINLRKKVVIVANISITKSITSNSAVIGAFYNNLTVPKFQLYINSSCKWSNANTTYYNYYDITAGGTVSLNTKYTPIVSTKTTQASDVTVYIFARNSDGSTLYIDGLRLYGMSITSGGIVVRDFIPVRVGQVGCLYDRVSSSLFYNQGTDNFTLGPDVT